MSTLIELYKYLESEKNGNENVFLRGDFLKYKDTPIPEPVFKFDPEFVKDMDFEVICKMYPELAMDLAARLYGIGLEHY